MNDSDSGRVYRMFLLLVAFLAHAFLPSPMFADVKGKAIKNEYSELENASVIITGITSDREKYNDRARIGDRILVKVDSLSTLMKFADNNIGNIKLRINDTVFSDLTPLRKVDDHTLEYELLKNDKNSAKWDSLSADVKRMVLPVKVSLVVANHDGEKLKVSGYDFRLILQTFRTGATLLVVVAIIFGVTFLKLGKRDARLRSYGPDSPYSLALVQMAVWYCVVTLAYTYLYTINGIPPTLNNSIMILIGISSATALGARIVDSSNVTKKESEGAEKSTDKGLYSAVKEGGLAEKMEKLTSKGFLSDILSDEYGFALSRYQIVIWTLVMLYIFVKDVLSLGVLHDFSDGELFLMGISSGSYVGYKLQENPSKKVK
jgi:hypothetical protein